MSQYTTEQINELRKTLSVRDRTGRTVLQVGLTVTLYVENAYRASVRSAVAECWEDYARRCGQHLRWSLNPDTDLMEPFGAGKGTRIGDWLPSLTERSQYALMMHGAEDDRGASDYYVGMLGIERRDYDTLSYFRASFPLLTMADHPTLFDDYVLGICNKLGPVSGYGGIGVIESPDRAISVDHQPLVYQWAQRFPGLEVDYPISHAQWLRKGREDGRPGIKGVNWITVLADRWVEELGGMEKVTADIEGLDSGFSIVPYAGGVLIRAGARPQLGYTDRHVWPELYVKLSRYLKPIRISQHRPFHFDNGGIRFDRPRSEAWLRRFDAR